MRRMWDRGEGGRTDPLVIDFTAGRDPVLDLRLVPYDCVASAAHARELARIGVLTGDEAKKLRRELGRIRDLCLSGGFEIPRELEDGHTAIEAELILRLGDVGEKIHAGRSRNDQAAAAVRLYLIDALNNIEWVALHLAEILLGRAKGSVAWPMPGFTHMRRAMPSTVGLWFAGFGERLLDDAAEIANAVVATDKSPMGTAAGYGSPLPLSRPRLARAAGFADVMAAATTAQLGRGRAELSALAAGLGLALTLDRFGADIVLFSSDEFGFFKFPDDLSTGSSIMPQKRNPDLAECLRPVSAMLCGCVVEVAMAMAHLPSGYHRDLAFTKGPLIDGLSRLDQALGAAILLAQMIVVDRGACAKGITAEMMQAHRAADLAARGTPFREAYRKVAKGGGVADGREVRVGIESPTVNELKALRERLGALRRPWRRVRMRIDRTTKAAFETGE